MAREVRRRGKPHWHAISERRVEQRRVELCVADLGGTGSLHRRGEVTGIVRRTRDEEVRCGLVGCPHVAPGDVHGAVRTHDVNRESIPPLVDAWAPDRLGWDEG